MAKTISREVTIYKYHFAHIDTATLSMTDLETIETAIPMSPRTVSAKGKELGDKLPVSTETETRKYELPIDLFIKACETYAKEQADLDLNQTTIE